MGMASILGYLIAGILIGPSVLGFVGAEGKDILHISEFGVVMMLFLIGLELEPMPLAHAAARGGYGRAADGPDDAAAFPFGAPVGHRLEGFVGL